jgi:hypothetical protein
LKALSYDWTALKNLIDAMTPNGNTNQGIGVAWAWQSLAQTAPLNAPAKEANYTYKDAIILLSDGLNTQNRFSSSASQIDARQKILCDNAKAAGVTVYTIQVNTSSPADPTAAGCNIAQAVPGTSTSSNPRPKRSRCLTRSEIRCRSCASQNNPCEFSTRKKARPQRPGFLISKSSVGVSERPPGRTSQPSPRSA